MKIMLSQQKTKGHHSLPGKNQKKTPSVSRGVLTQKCTQLVTLSIFCLRAEKSILCPIKAFNWVLGQKAGGSFSKGSQKDRSGYKVKAPVKWLWSK